MPTSDSQLQPQQQQDPSDESIPPKHEAYSFERKWEVLASRGFSKNDLVSATELLSLNGSGAKGDKADASASATTGAGEKKERVIKAPSDETVLLPPYKVRELLRSATSVARDTEERLRDVESDLDIYASGPIKGWVAARLALVEVEKMYGWLKRALGQAHLMNPLGQGYDAANALRRVQGALAQRVAEAERVPHFRAKEAESVLRTAQKREEELARVRKSGPEKWVDVFNELDAEKQREADAHAEEERKRRDDAYDAVGNRRAMMDAGELLQGHEGDKPQQQERKKVPKVKVEEAQEKLAEANGDGEEAPPGAPSAAGEEAADEESGGMFGNLLDEQPTQTTDKATNQVVHLRHFPEQAKSGGGGKSPKGVLLETLRRIDPSGKVSYAAVSGGGRIHRAKLTMRWCGPESAASSSAGAAPATPDRKSAETETRICVDTFQLTGEGCATQLQAEEMMATLALNCLERDRPVQRLLSNAQREWWEELQDTRGRDRDAASRSLVEQTRDAILPRLLSAPSAPKAPKIEAGELQKDFSELRTRAPPALSERDAENVRSAYQQRVQSKAYQDMAAVRQKLPISSYRERILELLENNQVLVLSAETGAGKSTQVPSYILEKCLSRGERCKIYCTEPRRISAISLAERVSVELGEAKGQVGSDSSLIGYAVRLESNVGRNAKLVFATTGIALRMLEGNAFDDITHIVIDEVHERTIESDFLLIILKTLCNVRPDLKVVLMSATIDAERIAAYFGGCPTLFVPGRTFPVQVYHLEDAVEMCHYILEDRSQYEKRVNYRGSRQQAGDNVAKLKSTAAEDDLLSDEEADVIGTQSFSKAYSPRTIDTIDRLDDRMVNHELIERLLEHICFENHELKGYSNAILIFMPGLAEIRACFDALTSHKLFGTTGFRIYPLHSTISTEDQAAVFEVPPPHIRKIVIATNIAETGITIPDCTCVIDTGKHREMRYDEKRHISKLVDCFIARSNAKQRRGRAGRVQPGLCFHLFTKLRFDSYVSLQRVVLEGGFVLNFLPSHSSTSTRCQRCYDSRSKTSR